MKVTPTGRPVQELIRKIHADSGRPYREAYAPLALTLEVAGLYTVATLWHATGD